MQKAKAEFGQKTPRLTPYQIKEFLEVVKKARDGLLAIDPEIKKDGQLWRDSLEGETDAFEVMRDLGRRWCERDADVQATKARKADIETRLRRFTREADLTKAVLLEMMQIAGVPSLPDAEFTATMINAPSRVEVAEGKESELPVEYVTIETIYTPDRSALKAALESGEVIEHVTLTNGGKYLQMRRK